jgi:hypothetical protein
MMNELELALVVMNAVRAQQLPSRETQADVSKDRPVVDDEAALCCDDELRSTVDRTTVKHR